ncbi:MAG: hypothetical protein QM733_17410 [Ilumatobacteraceae bacterium]
MVQLPGRGNATLTPFGLSATGDRWESDGELRSITIVDTRQSQPGWSTSAQLADFEPDTPALTAAHLGWQPTVSATSPGQTVQPGSAVASVLDGGPGLADPAVLATAVPGASRGTATIGAHLHLAAPPPSPPAPTGRCSPSPSSERSSLAKQNRNHYDSLDGVSRCGSVFSGGLHGVPSSHRRRIEEVSMKRSMRRGALSSVVAVGAMTMAFAGSAFAYDPPPWTLSEGHVDIVRVDPDGSGGLQLGIGNETGSLTVPPDPDPAQTTFEVPFTSALGGYVIPADQGDANFYHVLWAGFAGGCELMDAEGGPYSPNDGLTVTLTGVSYTPSGTALAPADVTISDPGASLSYSYVNGSVVDDDHVFVLDPNAECGVVPGVGLRLTSPRRMDREMTQGWLSPRSR